MFNCLYSSSESVAICVMQTIFYYLLLTIVSYFASELRWQRYLSVTRQANKTKKLLSRALSRGSGLRGIVEAWCDHFFYGNEQSCFAGKAYQFESVSSYILFS